MQSEQIQDLAAALVKAQAAIEGATKNSTNPHFRSQYADLGAVWDACREPFTKNGLAIMQMPRSFEGELRLVTRIIHSSGQWIEDDGFPLILGKNDMQGLGSATTYARRYGLMAAAGIAPEDDDGNKAVEGGEGKRVQGKGRANGATPKIDEQAEKVATFISGLTDRLSKCTTASALQDEITEILTDEEKKLSWIKEHYPEDFAAWGEAQAAAWMRVDPPKTAAGD